MTEKTDKYYSDLAKAELRRLKQIDSTIDAKLELKAVYEAKVERCISVITDMPRASDVGDKSGKFALLLYEVEQDIANLRDDYYDTTVQINRILDLMQGEDYANVLRYHYMAKMKFTVIANKINRSYRDTTRKHGYALIEYGKILDNFKSCPFVS